LFLFAKQTIPNKEVNSTMILPPLVFFGLLNNTSHAQSSSFYIKWRQVKTEWGVSGREGERERVKHGIKHRKNDTQQKQ
jgi:hypothetical protein